MEIIGKKTVEKTLEKHWKTKEKYGLMGFYGIYPLVHVDRTMVSVTIVMGKLILSMAIVNRKLLVITGE